MIFHTGPTKLALVLLCCIAPWLAICRPPFGELTRGKITLILKLLEHESKVLYENYSRGPAYNISVNESLQLPCFSLGQEALTNTLSQEAITSISVIKAHLEKVKELSENTVDTTKVTKRLEDISNCGPPNVDISGPEKNAYAQKVFMLTVLKRFSDCMAELQATAQQWREEPSVLNNTCPEGLSSSKV
ncbi:interleukin-31 [Grammomys surdaster]|uniref:interleukin-31 n=1 Tax=Grammomys surdaster TaxID=491861 RepID=UPI0010A0568C|nr:interleukin-31 [Grammomys surdaster]